MKDLGLHRFEQRKTTIIATLDHLGELEAVDAGRSGRDRLLRFDLRAPGQGLNEESLFIYSEWWTRVARGWRLTGYRYDYVDRLGAGRLGYHWHRVTRRSATYHAHCEESLGSPAFPHYRWYEVDLLEAHEDFVGRYASGVRIDCSGLRPVI